MALTSNQPLNLQASGLISAAGRKLSTQGVVEDDESGAGGANNSALNPFGSYAVAPNAPPPGSAQAPALKQFSFNPKFGNLAAGLDRRIADLGQQRSNNLFQANDMYNTQLSDAQRLQQDAIQRLQQRMAVRGLGSSSVMLNEQGNQEQNYQRYVDNLGRVRANQMFEAEQGYAGGVEGVNREREGLYFQQGQEEEQLARQRAQEEAMQQQRQQELAAQQAYQQWAMEQQMQQQQAQANAAYQHQQAILRAINAGGGGGGGGGGYQAPAAAPQGPQYGLENGQMVGEPAFLQAIASSPNQAWLNMLWDSPNQQGLPSHIRQAVLSRIAANRGWGGGSLAAL